MAAARKYSVSKAACYHGDLLEFQKSKKPSIAIRSERKSRDCIQRHAFTDIIKLVSFSSCDVVKTARIEYAVMEQMIMRPVKNNARLSISKIAIICFGMEHMNQLSAPVVTLWHWVC